MYGVGGVRGVRQPSGGSLQQGEFAGSGTRELYLADTNQKVGDAVIYRLDLPVRGGIAQVVDVTGDVALHQQSLQDVRNLLREPPGDRQLTRKQRDSFVHLLAQLIVGKPDEIVKANGKELWAVGQL